MYGTIPYYGIVYETADGEIHYYAISESGMDGSAELVKFEPTENPVMVDMILACCREKRNIRASLWN